MCVGGDHDEISALVRRGKQRWLSYHLQSIAERNVNTSQSDLQSQCNSYKNPNVIFCRNIKIHPKIHMKSQGIPNS